MLPTLFKTKQNKLLQSIFQSQYEKCLERNKILGMEKKSNITITNLSSDIPKSLSFNDFTITNQVDNFKCL